MNPKQCRGCLQTKTLDEFYRHPQMADGHLNYCKECKKLYERQRQALGANREYNRKRNLAPGRKAAILRRQRQERSTHPEKSLARQRLERAVRAGRVHKPTTCQRCGMTGTIMGHHADYNKPLDVIWLCRPCHGKYLPHYVGTTSISAAF